MYKQQFVQHTTCGTFNRSSSHLLMQHISKCSTQHALTEFHNMRAVYTDKPYK